MPGWQIRLALREPEQIGAAGFGAHLVKSKSSIEDSEVGRTSSLSEASNPSSSPSDEVTPVETPPLKSILALQVCLSGPRGAHPNNAGRPAVVCARAFGKSVATLSVGSGSFGIGRRGSSYWDRDGDRDCDWIASSEPGDSLTGTQARSSEKSKAFGRLRSTAFPVCWTNLVRKAALRTQNQNPMGVRAIAAHPAGRQKTPEMPASKVQFRLLHWRNDMYLQSCLRLPPWVS